MVRVMRRVILLSRSGSDPVRNARGAGSAGDPATRSKYGKRKGLGVTAVVAAPSLRAVMNLKATHNRETVTLQS